MVNTEHLDGAHCASEFLEEDEPHGFFRGLIFAFAFTAVCAWFALVVSL
jgi:hypothetical protein